MTDPDTNQAWYLTTRPDRQVGREHFEVRDDPIPRPADGHVLVRNIYLMVPASMRLWMNEGETYLPPQPLGEVMRGITLGVVEQSRAPGLPVGTFINAMGGWQHYFVAAPRDLLPVTPHPAIPLATYRTVLDFQGLTAYCGLTDVCQPEPGQTLVVTAAAGSVGSLVCQIGKKLGLRVVGVAGGADKCAWLLNDCGADGAIDYKNDDVEARLAELCPRGVDMLFENVGGAVMDAVLDRINSGARIALCGLVSTYNGAEPAMGRSLMQLVNQRGRIQGFIVADYLPRLADVVSVLEPWILDGSLIYQTEIIDGLERTIEAMNRLARGQNRGMQLIRVTAEPSTPHLAAPDGIDSVGAR